MEVWAVLCRAGWLFREPVDAELRLVVGWVVEPLLPSVTQPALEPVGTAILVFVDRLFGRPVGALFRRVMVLVGLTSKLLPVVGEDTGVSVVISVNIGAPDRLVVEEVEVRVHFKLVNLVDANVVVSMRKATVLAIFAQTGFRKVTLTKLCLVLVRVVKFLHSIVAEPALVALRTQLLLRH